MGSSLLDGLLKRKKDSEKASFYVNKQQYILSFRLCQVILGSITTQEPFTICYNETQNDLTNAIETAP